MHSYISFNSRVHLEYIREVGGQDGSLLIQCHDIVPQEGDGVKCHERVAMVHQHCLVKVQLIQSLRTIQGFLSYKRYHMYNSYKA